MIGRMIRLPFMVSLMAFALSAFLQAGSARADDKEADIKASLDKLDKEDRALAEAQKFCPIMEDTRLGEMGVPIKITIKDKPVFLCCKGCKKKALADEDKTLAKVEDLKKKNKKPEPKK